MGYSYHFEAKDVLTQAIVVKYFTTRCSGGCTLVLSWLTSEVASSINCEKKIGHKLVTVFAWRLTEFRPL
ncbi:hypothetical protein OUZ56_019313 [Daphnia magna]|uniref:Uncharacterized protein n=1 Tax=Daphnia magna TaxID=35525 RepID=A0ABQ9ZCA6_9CRUS|nr:hypothetical protein OUZ56_019313 [Daphnia magna]